MNGNGAPANGNGTHPPREPVAVGPGIPSAPARARVSPLRPDAIVEPAAALPPIRPGDPVPTYAEPPDAAAFHADEHEEPPLPDEVRAVVATAAAAPTRPTDAGPGRILHVRFGGASTERVVQAMKDFRQLVRERPGETRVVVHVPAPGGSALPLELRGVAYDAELLAEIRRRLGEGAVDLQLA